MSSSLKSKISSRAWAVIGLAASLILIIAGIQLSDRIEAIAMHLLRTEGTVAVADGEGKEITPRENLALYGGYGVETHPVSYAWIDLDKVKLIKMDEESEIEIQKEEKHLNIDVKSGGLFFNVTEPLADDETMNIRTSTMVVGIRGTCGWVADNGGDGSQVFILEGRVEAAAVDTGETVEVSAGEMAQLTVDEDGETTLEVQPFAEEYIVPFVMTELEDDAALSDAVLAASGLDVLNPPDPAERLAAEYDEMIAEHTILDKWANEGVTYTENGITYGSEGISEIYRTDLNEDGKEEVILVIQQSSSGWPGGPITRLEVYEETMGHLRKLDEVSCGEGLATYAQIMEKEGELYLCLWRNIVPWEFVYSYRLDGDSLILGDDCAQLDYEESSEIANTYIHNEKGDEAYQVETPSLPDEVQWKNGYLDELDNYGGQTNHWFAKFMDINGNGTEELIIIEDDYLSYCSWSDSDVHSTDLEHSIRYAKLIDMDQDGIEELVLVIADYSLGENYHVSVKAYSLNETVGFKKLLDIDCEEVSSGFWHPEQGVGIYRDSVTGNIYIGSGEFSYYGASSYQSLYYGLTDSVEAIFDDPFARHQFQTEEEEARAYEELERQDEEYRAQVDRFEEIEWIYPESQSLWDSMEELEYTVDEVRRQLRER